MGKLIPIREAAKMLGVSIDTLRRWDAKGLLKSFRTGERGHRYYQEEDLDIYLKDLFSLAKKWACSVEAVEPQSPFYCRTTSIFQARLEKLALQFSKMEEFKDIFSLLTAIAGEIGNNSFDHNLGNWLDVPGIFFGYDINKREIVLADRGQGVLKTLQRVRPSLHTDAEALQVAFTEVISGRAPEARGNGLKFVKQVVEASQSIKLLFQTGNARLEIYPSDTELYSTESDVQCRGCLAFIIF